MRPPIPIERLSFANCAPDTEAGHLSSAARGSATSTTPLPITSKAPPRSTPGGMDRRAARDSAWPPRTLSPNFSFFSARIWQAFGRRRLEQPLSTIGWNFSFARTRRLESTLSGRASPPPWTPQLGGKCAYRGRLAKDRSPRRSRRSIAGRNTLYRPSRTLTSPRSGRRLIRWWCDKVATNHQPHRVIFPVEIRLLCTRGRDTYRSPFPS
jgi:hypothetical protein